MMKYFKIISGFLVFLLLLAGFYQPMVHSETEFLMDTVISVTAYGPHAKKAIHSVFLKLREIDQKCNAHEESSDIFKINLAPANVPVSVDGSVFQLIEDSLAFSEITEGAFDITLFPISKLWGFKNAETTIPKEEDLMVSLADSGADKLILDKEKNTITKTRNGTQLDLGAIAKGYAAEEAVRILKEENISHAYLDLGGNIAVMGGKPNSFLKRLFTGRKSEPFVIGLQMPDAPRGTVMETLSLTDGFVVTSGDYERYFEVKGKRYHHILDPKTGHPAESGLKSVTVVSDNGREADMLSTALFVLGEENVEALQSRCRAIFVVDNQMNLKTLKSLHPNEN